MFSHIDRDLTIRSKAGRQSCAVLGSREIDKENTGKERSSVSCDVSVLHRGHGILTIGQPIIGNERTADLVSTLIMIVGVSQ